jgi:hypothetical protein
MCAAGMSEERLREIVSEEILAARLAEKDHEHLSLPGATTTTTWRSSAHEHDFTHDHYGEYADAHHVHHGQWG